MPRRLLLVAGLAAAALAAQADEHRRDRAPEPDARPPEGMQKPASREWTRFPLLVPVVRGGERNAAMLRPQGIDPADVVIYAAGGPDARRKVAYPIVNGSMGFESAAPQVGNYHWAMARQESEAEVRVASTVWYFSNPGPAPTELLAQPKSEFEIVPRLLPREHSNYREAEEWQFLVRWNGAPLPDQKVTLETEFGSRSSYLSDADGAVVVLLPRDFRERKERAEGTAQMMGPQRAKFVLAAERDVDGRHYVTAFNYTYSPDPERTRSLGWGAAFGVVGMVAALPLLRRRGGQTDAGENKNA